jgi:hypothetical protein
MDPFPHAMYAPNAEGVIHRLPQRPLVWQQAPGAAGAQDVHDGISTGAQGTLAGPTRFRLRRHEGLHHTPLGVSLIGSPLAVSVAAVGGDHPSGGTGWLARIRFAGSTSVLMCRRRW